MLGKIEGRRRRGRQRMRLLDGITDTMDVSLFLLGYSQWLFILRYKKFSKNKNENKEQRDTRVLMVMELHHQL